MDTWIIIESDWILASDWNKYREKARRTLLQAIFYYTHPPVRLLAAWGGFDKGGDGVTITAYFLGGWGLGVPTMLSPLFAIFGFPGHLELLVIAGLALLLFGNRLPSVMRSLGRSVVEFKKGVNGIEDEIDSVSKSIDAQTRSDSSHSKES